jgi:hypothetical protein
MVVTVEQGRWCGEVQWCRDRLSRATRWPMLIVLNWASASLTPLTTTANAQTNHTLLTFRSCYQPL